MDSDRFDRFSRVLASGESRRAAFGALVALGLGGLAWPLASARHKHKHHHKKKHHHKGDGGGAGTCQAGADRCNGGNSASCNATGGCYCYTTIQGEARCGINIGAVGACGECTTDDQCFNNPAYGPGAFCAHGGGGLCGCIEGAGFCNLPCPAE